MGHGPECALCVRLTVLQEKRGAHPPKDGCLVFFKKGSRTQAVMCPDVLLGRKGKESKQENCTFRKDKAGQLLQTLCYLF